MGFLNRIFQQETDAELRDVSTNVANYAQDIKSHTEEVIVNLETVRTIPCVSACLDIICGSIAQLPVYLYKENEDGSVEKIQDDYRTFLLNNEANINLKAYDYKKNLVEQYLMGGVSYTYLDKKANDIVGLYPLEYTKVSVDKNIKNKPWKYDLQFNYESERIKSYNMMCIHRNTKDGSEGRGLLEEGRQIFALSLNENTYTSNILSKGALPIGMLKTSSRLAKGTIDKLRASFENLYSGAKNSGKTIILEEGLDYSPLSLKPSDLNLNEGRKMSNQQICVLFNTPTSLVLGDKSLTDEDNLQYMKFCIGPIINAIESGFDNAFLLEEEKMQNYYFRFDITELERSTVSERYNYIEKGIKSGVTSINEARAILDLPKIEKDYLLLSLGNIFYDMKTGNIEVPNTGQNVEEKNTTEDQQTEEDNQQDQEETPKVELEKEDVEVEEDE